MSAVSIAQIGAHGHHSVLNLKNRQKVRLVAIGDEPGYPTSLSSEAAIQQVPYYTDYRKMLDEVRPSIVSIGCRYALNGRAILNALQYGTKVISEKPIANSLEELDSIDLLVKERNLIVIPEFTMRWHPAFMTAQSLVASGRIGRVVLVAAQKSYPFGSRPEFYKHRSLYGGTIGWIGTHAIDQVLWCTGLAPASVMARCGNLSLQDYPGCEDHAALLLGFEGGESAIITTDFLFVPSPKVRRDDRIRIIGEKGWIEVRHGTCHFASNDQPEVQICEGAVDADAVALDLLECAKGASAKLTWRDAFNATRIALIARDSAKKGIPLTISF